MSQQPHESIKSPRNRHEKRSFIAKVRKEQKTQIDTINDKLAENIDDDRITHVFVRRATKATQYISVKRLMLPTDTWGRFDMFAATLARAMQGFAKKQSEGVKNV